MSKSPQIFIGDREMTNHSGLISILYLQNSTYYLQSSLLL